MADVKTLLKEARKLIDEKNYKEAQECCKSILRKDKQNYFGLVLLGKSFQDSDQAPLAYQKAIACKPDQPLAWQGLANFYELQDDNHLKTKLLPIYKGMLNLQWEEEKSLEVISKLGQLGCLLQNAESLEILISYINKEPVNNLKEAAEKQIVDLIKANVPCKDEHIPQVISILNNIYKSEPSEMLELLYAKVIIQKCDQVLALEEIIKLPFFSKNVVLREWLCKHLCMNYIDKMSFNNFNIENNINLITQGITNSKYPSLLKSMMLYDTSFYLEAYKLCVPLINYNEADKTEAIFIIRCTNKLKKWSVSQKLATNFLTKAKEAILIIELKKLIFLALARQYKWKQAISVVKEIPHNHLSKLEQAILAECFIEANEPADDILKELQTSEHYIQLQALLLMKQEKYEEIINLLLTHDHNALNIFYLGKAYWGLKQFDKCHINLLKAAKLNPDHADTFLYLGHFYNNCKNDMDKAKKCYEKAFSLNSIDCNIAKHLSEVYIKLGEKEADYDLLNNIKKNTSSNESWLNLRLGLHYLNKREWDKAIINFRDVIKRSHNDATALECLADAYYSRGSYSSALRAYNKVMTLDASKACHCLTRIGYIYSLLTQYEEAIATFEKVLTIDSYSILALKGVAETWVRVAKKKVAAKIYGSARDCAQRAVVHISTALSKEQTFSCFWKLMADTLIFITNLPNKYAYVLMPAILVKDTGSDVVKKDKDEIFPQAIACYSHIAKQKQHCTSYDLASAYLAFSHNSKKQATSLISFNLAITCIKEKPSLWRYWNLLGKICIVIKKYEIAQHCFIKALILTRKWSVAKIWCNLGTLYIKLKLYKLANYCFWRGQSTLPSYPQSWIGQGLIAEEIREEEAMDLFRHASRLGYHPESALGYADWVCRTLITNKYMEDREYKYIIEGLYAIPYAMDLIEWYSNFEPNNAWACNILGILQERSGLIRPALKSYEKALECAEEDRKNIILLNIGRTLVRLERYEDAVKIYKAITEASLYSTTGLALALLKKGLYEEAYSVYDTALHWLSNNDDEKADLLVAMAGILYIHKGIDNAKTILFRSIQISQTRPTANSLFAICSLGLIHSDQSLSKLALGELKKYELDINFGFDIGFLRSYMFVCEDKIEHAITLLSDSVHDHPSNPMLWYCMAQYCLRATNEKAKIASTCAQKALLSAEYGQCDCNSGKFLATASIAEHLAGDYVKSLRLAKKGIHMYPNQAEMRAALLFSLLSHPKLAEKKEWILISAGNMRKHINMSRPLARWVNFMEKKLQR